MSINIIYEWSTVACKSTRAELITYLCMRTAAPCPHHCKLTPSHKSFILFINFYVSSREKPFKQISKPKLSEPENNYTLSQIFWLKRISKVLFLKKSCFPTLLINVSVYDAKDLIIRVFEDSLCYKNSWSRNCMIKYTKNANFMKCVDFFLQSHLEPKDDFSMSDVGRRFRIPLLQNLGFKSGILNKLCIPYTSTWDFKQILLFTSLNLNSPFRFTEIVKCHIRP